jgi:hypothetical protein
MKKALYIFAVLLAVFVLVMNVPPSLFQGFVYRMAPPPFGPNGKNLAQELGFEKDVKLLVVNSDDTGASPTFTDGILKVVPVGIVRSTSVIVHNRNNQELTRIAKITKKHKDWGVGIHLMLTNEYRDGYPCAPVLPKSLVPKLYNDKGLAWEKISEVETNVNPTQAEMEFSAQTDKALRAGIKLTHIESHMGTYYRQSSYNEKHPDGLLRAAAAVAEKYNLPITMNGYDANTKTVIDYLVDHHIIRPDTLFGF